MRKRIAPLILAIAATAPAIAQACDQEDAQDRWQQAEEAGVILGVGMVNDIPSFAVDTATWRDANLSTRQGMVETFECLVGGAGNVLTKARVLTAGGEVLAEWDGAAKHLEIK